MREDDKKESKIAKFEHRQLNNSEVWTTCALSGADLAEPIVSDYKGRLYNKDAVLEYLISPSEENHAHVQHIRSTRDIIELKITRKNAVWICPVSLRDVVKESVSNPFVYISECGHVLAESVTRELKDNCPVVSIGYVIFCKFPS